MTPWLDNKFVERVLRSSENDDTICVTDITTRPATNEGDNYSSVMIRVSVDFKRYEGAKVITDKLSIIVKTEVDDDSQKKMDTKFSSKCLFTQQRNPAVLVLEDLATSGFRMVDRLGRLNFQHSMLALSNLAKFHAASVAVCEKAPKYKDILSNGLFHTNMPPEFTQFYFVVRMKGLARTVASWPGFDERYSEKLLKLSDVVCDKVADCQKRDNNEFNVINHNDYWTNNMLFKYDSDDEVIDHVMVDFQACYYGSPAIDLVHFFNICISEIVSDIQRRELMEEYLKVLTTTMHKLECERRPPEMEELNKAMHKREVYGLLASCVMLPFMIVDGKKLTSDDEVYEDETFRVELSKKLHRWNDMGLLDL